MRGISISVSVAILVAGILAAGVRAQPDVVVVHRPTTGFALQLGPPRAPAHLSEAEALRAAEKVWTAATFTEHPYSLRYGAYHTTIARRTSLGLQPVGTRDVWAITVTGLDIPRPAAEIAEPDGTFQVVTGPDVRTEVILVDDKAGSVLESIGY